MKGGIPSEFIEQVKLANNIVTVASKYFRVTAKGRTHWAPCPFHHEKTPSFAINEAQQYYHCFGCGVSGNVVGLVMHCESVDFVEAIALLAKWAGLEMPRVERDDGYAERAKKKQRILDILESTRQYYCSNLTRGRSLPEPLPTAKNSTTPPPTAENISSTEKSSQSRPSAHQEMQNSPSLEGVAGRSPDGVVITPATAATAFNLLGIDDLGLDRTDINILTTLLDKFAGGPVGLETLAAAANEDPVTIEDIVEPYLLQLGYIAKTPRGRIATPNAYKHFGKSAPKNLSFFDQIDENGEGFI